MEVLGKVAQVPDSHQAGQSAATGSQDGTLCGKDRGICGRQRNMGRDRTSNEELVSDLGGGGFESGVPGDTISLSGTSILCTVPLANSE